jgi:hypothetical protein
MTRVSIPNRHWKPQSHRRGYTMDAHYFTTDLPHFIDSLATHPKDRCEAELRALSAVADPRPWTQREYPSLMLVGPPPQIGITAEILRRWMTLMAAVCEDGSIDDYWG